MTMPFGYASPEQQVRDRSEYARKGIARGRSVVVRSYADGILFVAENPSSTLHKISEIYDRVAFAAVGKYNEFENLRTAGVRMMDVRGYMYDRRDVTGRALANFYAQTLGTIFTDSIKPYEVEIVVSEVGEDAASDQIYRLTYDGSIADERGFVAIGGQSEQVNTSLKEHHADAQPLATALRVAANALRAGTPPGANGDRVLSSANLEVAMLDRTRNRRLFKRISGPQLDALLAETADTPG
ncbi:proteasome subunit alpha [Frankia sp. CiP1_Cm_nod1]|uniref:proteasome subunit alpha n=2 Tax=unclassified Frankia TaxID=2632575 RepID=UPI00202547E9